VRERADARPTILGVGRIDDDLAVQLWPAWVPITRFAGFEWAGPIPPPAAT
jgi:hypothetical protein